MRASPRSCTAFDASSTLPPWSGWTRRMRDAELGGELLRVGNGEPTGKPSTSSAQARGSASDDSDVALVPARWAISVGPIGPRQRTALCKAGPMTAPAGLLESFEGVHGAEHHRQRRPVGVEGEPEVVALCDTAGAWSARARGGRPGTGGAAGAAPPGHRARPGRSSGGGRGSGRRRRHGRARRRRRRAAARRGRGADRWAGRGCRAPAGTSARAVWCATPPARRGAFPTPGGRGRAVAPLVRRTGARENAAPGRRR